jgi:phosphopantetheine--protein transferase-like protein
MDGDATLDELRAYLTRLTGQAVTADAALDLRSVHRAALASWARGRKLTLQLAAISSGKPFTLRDLVAGASAAAAYAPAAVSIPAATPLPAAGIGIDIEEVANLPEAPDYREHAFYQDNFTAAEIAYCLRQADARASFCGLWAAKEAIYKSGLALPADGKLKWIEIGRDDKGRPVAAGCQLSISHTSTTAVAVCLAVQAAAPVQVAVPVAAVAAAVPAGTRRGIAIAAASVLVGAIVAGLALHGLHVI